MNKTVNIFFAFTKKRIFFSCFLLGIHFVHGQIDSTKNKVLDDQFSLKISSLQYPLVFTDDLMKLVIGWKKEQSNHLLHFTIFSKESFSDKKLRGLCFITSIKKNQRDSAVVELNGEDSLTINIPEKTKLQVHFLIDPVPYPVRFLLIEYLSKKYPLPAGRDAKGYWAGIYYFSKWQYDSGRDTLPIWEKVNRSFTINPYLLYYLSEKDSSINMLMNGLLKRNWNNVFRKDHDQKKNLKILWTAHANALSDGMQRMEKELDSLHIPEEEIRFWRGRVKVIFFLSKINFPTARNVVVPIINLLEPPCSPIGCADCKVRDMHPGLRKLYVHLLMHLGRTKIKYKI